MFSCYEKCVWDRERTEKVRQELMRFNELLGLMRGKLVAGERTYQELFAGLAPEELAGLNHKEVQCKLAEQLDDLTPLKQAVTEMRFGARELEKGFSELSGIIAETPDSSDEEGEGASR